MKLGVAQEVKELGNALITGSGKAGMLAGMGSSPIAEVSTGACGGVLGNSLF